MNKKQFEKKEKEVKDDSPTELPDMAGICACHPGHCTVGRVCGQNNKSVG